VNKTIEQELLFIGFIPQCRYFACSADIRFALRASLKAVYGTLIEESISESVRIVCSKYLKFHKVSWFIRMYRRIKLIGIGLG
jgi:hypothetical protein